MSARSANKLDIVRENGSQTDSKCSRLNKWQGGSVVQRGWHCSVEYFQDEACKLHWVAKLARQSLLRVTVESCGETCPVRWEERLVTSEVAPLLKPGGARRSCLWVEVLPNHQP